MNVTATGASSSALYGPAQARPTPPPMTNTAQLLGVSTSELKQDLQSGATLSGLASQKGISSSDLITSIASDLKANAPAGAPTLSGTQLTQIATNIANGTGRAGAHHHHHGGGGAPPPLNDTAQLLGVSTSELNQDLQSGATLSGLASQKGVSSSDLISSIESDLKANAPQGAPTLSSTQLSQIATSIANGQPPVGGGQDLSGVSSSSPISSVGGTNARAENNLSSLASTLGIDPSSLLAQLNSGQNLSSLLSGNGNGDTGYGTSIANSITGGLAVDTYA